MLITADRVISDSDTTLSVWSVDGAVECAAVEDEYREVKVDGETRIPAGTYKVVVHTEGRFHSRYSEKFPFHAGMLHILDVPGFEWILIHIGNTDDDTSGCPCVGESMRISGRLGVINSTLAYERLYKKVIGSALAEELHIAIRDLDRR